MTWAVEAPIERPTAKLALVCLADHADEDGLCFPSQKSLAAKVGVSERALRDALSWLEVNGYIVRSARHRKDGSRTSNAYQLPPEAYRKNFPHPRKQTQTQPEESAGLTSFEPPTEPTTAVSREEKHDYDLVQSVCLEAAGMADFRAERSPALMNLAPILGMLSAGFHLTDEIAPAIRAKSATGFKFRSWALVPDLVAEYAAKYRKAAGMSRPVPKPIDWPARVRAFEEDGTWAMSWGPRPGDPGCLVPDEVARAAA